MSNFQRPVPQPSPESKEFWEGCRQGKLLMQYCNDCGKINWFPRRYCAHCTAESFTWKEVEGTGILETFSIVYRPMSDAWKSEVPYALAIVRLTEGVRMVTRIIMKDGRQPRFDAPVRVRFIRLTEEFQIPYFEELE